MGKKVDFTRMFDTPLDVTNSLTVKVTDKSKEYLMLLEGTKVDEVI